ncbi:hypothetical protein KV097_05420 [Mumia sp. zg.B17]|uniref:hypothetical protein n=1 Tax=Mumia sp. zg.B17 TaxID=2855446 RepID=UPI001C6E6424|nr:hypothetical protein [Mumia sp. zg.B17]MBW9205378.1 hypothetical protein [Mumia sp. zg.B17]
MRTVYPYPILAGDVTITLGHPTTDGDLARGSWRDPDARVVDMSNLERRNWSTVDIPVEMVGPPTELRDRIRDGGDPRAHVVVHCSFTNARQAFELAPDSDGSRWRGRISVDRPFWFGRISAAGYITDHVPAGKHRIVGIADSWHVYLDDLPRSPVRGALTVVWRDFDDRDVDPPVLTTVKGEPYYHFLDPNEPVLFLNAAFPGLEPLLRDRSHRPLGEQSLHDQVRATIATKFFLAAANAALGAVRHEDGEAPAWPDSDWQSDLLQTLFHHAYPKKSSDDALAEVMAMLDSDDGAGQVQSTLISAVDRHVGSSRLLRLGISRLGLEPEAEHEQEDE